ncbi:MULTISPECIES: alpha/beta family hydrolase [Marinobacter]|uniref:alpha/beta family hydrolase n=1 Tax=Marinobacter TaxID=2742 RepID=UPI001B187F58|nr:alpha/beta family hydrolase [Marinobacter sp.]MBO6811296.1 dienelactone hydrolase family protein [Marinobacter sp.]MBO6874679.1 dienelactone hydrolase family protein [Marinobacter sp.]
MELIKTKGYESHSKVVLILAHGAGAPADSTFMEDLSVALEREGIGTIRFEFPYMQKRRQDGKKRPPDREPVLLEYFSGIIDRVRAELGSGSLILVGGKSMGGRMASILASRRDDIDGVICFGYPFHPPGKLDRWRTAHFRDLNCPILVLQGTRDPFGKPDELADHQRDLEAIDLRWLEGGNHDFQTLKSQPQTQSELIAQAARETRIFVDERFEF